MVVRVAHYWGDVQHQLTTNRRELAHEALHDRNAEFGIAIRPFSCQLIERSAQAKETGYPCTYVGVMHVRAGILRSRRSAARQRPAPRRSSAESPRLPRHQAPRQ